MRTIGLLGGMSWESTATYYRVINETMRERLGGLHSARLLLHSVEFHEMGALQREGRWEEMASILGDAGRGLRLAGADFLVICTNTMHRMAATIEAGAGLPVLHIADATAAAIGKAEFETVGLLGTRYTMEQDFYRGRLEERHGLEVLVPGEAGRELVHRVIYEELCRGVIRDEARAAFLGVIDELAARGAQGVILGCTEISLLVGPRDTTVPLFDTTTIHARAAVDRALEP